MDTEEMILVIVGGIAGYYIVSHYLATKKMA